jgi:hypothetical protein
MQPQLPAPLPIVAPPQLEDAVCWTGGDSRWLSATWTSLGDTVWLSDGVHSMTGNGWGWLAFSRHPAVQPALRDADLGCSLREGVQRVLIDRHSRRCYLVDHGTADLVLDAQRPQDEPVVLSHAELEELVRRAAAHRVRSSGHAILAAMRRHAATVAALVRLLDEWAVARRSGDR